MTARERIRLAEQTVLFRALARGHELIARESPAASPLDEACVEYARRVPDRRKSVRVQFGETPP